MPVVAGGSQLGLGAQGGRRGRPVDLGERSVGPGERLLDVGVRVAHQLPEER
jgi:hypothetical protein